jgi:hypothetical protein
MPKPVAKANLIHQQILGGLIATAPVSWTRKSLTKDKDGKESVVKTRVTGTALRFPLAQNVSDFNINRMAERWAR